MTAPDAPGTLAGDATEDCERARGAAVPGRREGRAAWAREHGIDGRSLHARGTNLARSGKAGPRLVELVPSASSRLEPRHVVRVGELAVELGGDFCEETVVRLVRALRGC